MNTDRYFYHIEVNMHPIVDGNADAPYLWTIWEIDKFGKTKEDFKSGWATSPQKAWQQAMAHYNSLCGKSFTEVRGIKHVYQPQYVLSDNTKVNGDVYESEQEAHNHALVVDYVGTEEGPKKVEDFHINSIRYIPSCK